MLTTLIYLLIVLAVIGVAWWAITQFTLPQPVRVIAVVVIAIVAIVLLLGLLPGGHGLSLR